MFVLLHVVIALSSVAYTTYLFLAPSKLKFYVSYGLIGMTLASGTYLVITTHSPLLSSCEAGLAYLGVVLCGLIAARHRLVSNRVPVRDHEKDL
jgi:hypothetical protein